MVYKRKRFLQLRLGALLLGTMLLTLGHTLIAQSSADDKVLYEDNRFTIEFPAHWELRENQPGVVVAAISPEVERRSRFDRRVTVGYQALASEEAFIPYFEQNLEALKTHLHRVSVHHTRAVGYGPNSGKEILLTHHTTRIPVTLRVVMLPGPDLVYVLICAEHRDHYDQSSDLFDRILASFIML